MTAQNKKAANNYFLPEIVLTALLVSFLLSGRPALAQEEQKTFIISPPSVNFTLDPGQQVEKSIKVTNQSGETTDFAVDLKDFIVTDTQGTPELLSPGTVSDNKYAGSTWGTALPDRFTLAPGESATTTLYLRVPADARPGGRYFAVAFRPLITGVDGNSSGAAINTIIGSIVYLTVAGPVVEKAEVTRFTAPFFSEYGPVNFTTEIKNLSDIHINPKATLEVKNLFGQKVYSDALGNVNIFPGTSRIYENSYVKKWLIGRFTADLSGYYGSTNLPLTASLVFWVIPYKLIVAILLAIVIFFLIVYLAKRGKGHHSDISEEKINSEAPPIQ